MGSFPFNCNSFLQCECVLLTGSSVQVPQSDGSVCTSCHHMMKKTTEPGSRHLPAVTSQSQLLHTWDNNSRLDRGGAETGGADTGEELPLV